MCSSDLEVQDVAIQGATIGIFAIFTVFRGAGLVDHPGEDDESAEADAGAARGVLGKVVEVVGHDQSHPTLL